MESEGVEQRKARYLGGRSGTPGQGPFLALVLKVEDDRIVMAQFQTYGCPSAIACGRFLTEWLEGRLLEEAAAIGPAEIAAGVGGLPLGKEFTASLSIDALKDALNMADERRRTKDEGV